MDQDIDASQRRTRPRESPDLEEITENARRRNVRMLELEIQQRSQMFAAINVVKEEQEDHQQIQLKTIRRSHLPWMDHYRPAMRGCPAPNNKSYKLFVTDDLPNPADRLMDQGSKEAYIIDLFFQWRYFRNETTVKDQPTPDALADSWTTSVETYTPCPSKFLEILESEKGKFERFWEGMKMKLHQMCVAENKDCAMLKEQECPMCYSSAPRLPALLRYPDSHMRTLSDDLYHQIQKVDSEWELQQRRKEEEHLHSRRAIQENERQLVMEKDILFLMGRNLETSREMGNVRYELKETIRRFDELKAYNSTLSHQVADIQRLLEGSQHLVRGVSLPGLVAGNHVATTNLSSEVDKLKETVIALQRRLHDLDYREIKKL